MGVCYGHVPKVDIARGDRVAVGDQVISYRVVLDEGSGKIQDIGTKDDRVRDGAGVAGQQCGGELPHRVVEWNERLWSGDGLKDWRHCSNKEQQDTTALTKLPAVSSLQLRASVQAVGECYCYFPMRRRCVVDRVLCAFYDGGNADLFCEGPGLRDDGLNSSMQVHERDEPVQDPARNRVGISSDIGKGVQANEVENDNIDTPFSTVTSM